MLPTMDRLVNSARTGGHRSKTASSASADEQGKATELTIQSIRRPHYCGRGFDTHNQASAADRAGAQRTSAAEASASSAGARDVTKLAMKVDATARSEVQQAISEPVSGSGATHDFCGLYWHKRRELFDDVFEHLVG
jgi:hypothetical protein